MELLDEFVGIQAVIDFEEGDMNLLLERVRERKMLTEGEWQAVQHVLETAAVGKKWRPAHRTRRSETRTRASEYYRRFDYLVVREGWPRKRALATVAETAGLTERRLEQMFDELGFSIVGWRGNVAIGIARKLVREGVPQEVALERAAAAMRISAEKLKAGIAKLSGIT